MYMLQSYLDENRIPYFEKTLVCENNVRVQNPKDAYEILNQYFRLGERTEEYAYMFCVNTKADVIGVYEVSHGVVDASFLNNREIFMKALVCGASAIILAHNHPSGDITPSSTDINTMKKIKKAGELLGIKLADFMIISKKIFYSAMQEGDL